RGQVRYELDHAEPGARRVDGAGNEGENFHDRKARLNTSSGDYIPLSGNPTVLSWAGRHAAPTDGERSPMEERFYAETMQALVDDAWLPVDASVLVVAATQVDREVVAAAGLRTVTLSNLDDRLDGTEFTPYAWSFQDASTLTFEDGCFDFCVCHQ